MGHALLKKAILLLKMANVRFDLLLAVYEQIYLSLPVKSMYMEDVVKENVPGMASLEMNVLQIYP